jgi:hypothetical protein
VSNADSSVRIEVVCLGQQLPDSLASLGTETDRRSVGNAAPELVRHCGQNTLKLSELLHPSAAGPANECMPAQRNSFVPSELTVEGVGGKVRGFAAPNRQNELE